MSDNCVLPRFSSAEAAEIARRLFALDGPIAPLDGERDLNYRIDDARGRFVFKIANELESPAMLECQHAVLLRLAQARVFPAAATALPSVDGNAIEFVRDAEGRRHACRVLPYIDGRVLGEVVEPSADLLEDLGRCLARVDLALRGFEHPALERPLLWRMDRALEIIAAYESLLRERERRGLIAHFAGEFRARRLPRLRRAVIHNDANRGNVLVDASARRVVSLIDFGDMVEGWLAAEPAIAAAYVMLDATDPLGRAAAVVRGYHAELALAPEELEAIFDLVCMRLCMSVCISAHQQQLEPGNAYLAADSEPAWALLAYLRSLPREDFAAALPRPR